MAALKAAIDMATAQIGAFVPMVGASNIKASVGRSPAGGFAGAAWKWPAVVGAGGVVEFAELEEAIATYAATFAASGVAGTAAKEASVEAAVVVAIARAAAVQAFRVTPAQVTAGELTVRAAGEARLEIGEEVAAVIAAATARWAGKVSAFVALALYNAAGAETYGVMHAWTAMPAAWSEVSRAAELPVLDAGMRGTSDRLATEVFFPLAECVLGRVACTMDATSWCLAAGFVALERALPVVSAEAVLATSLPLVLSYARSFEHEPADLPAAIAVPAELTAAAAALAAAVTIEQVVEARCTVKAFARILEPVVAYVVGFVSGKESRLNSRAASRVIEEVVGEGPGTWAAFARVLAANDAEFRYGSLTGWAYRGIKMDLAPARATAVMVASLAAAAGKRVAERDAARNAAIAAVADEVDAHAALAKIRAAAGKMAAAIAAAGDPPGTLRTPPAEDPAALPAPAPDEHTGPDATASV